MLGEAHRRLERGTDLVAAVVETHGRKKTAELLDGIDIIPPRYIDYRGGRFPELDVPAVLARRPQVVLVDELAHQHPGQQEPETLDGRRRTARRRHLGDLHRQRAAPREPQRRRRADHRHRTAGDGARRDRPPGIPDRTGRHHAGSAAPQAFPRQRLRPEKVDAALSNYFRRGNLTALRELALLWLADQVDAALAKYRADNKITATWEARGRVVVAVTGGPESRNVGTPGIPDRVEVQRRADDRSRGARRWTVRGVGPTDGQGPRSWPPASAPLYTPSSVMTCQKRCWTSPVR